MEQGKLLQVSKEELHAIIAFSRVFPYLFEGLQDELINYLSLRQVEIDLKGE